MTEKDEIEAILEVFTTKGWQLILTDMQGLYDQINSIQGCDTHDEFLKRKGEIERLGWFLNLEAWYRFTQEDA